MELDARVHDVRQLLGQAAFGAAEVSCRSILEHHDDATVWHLLGYIGQQTGQYDMGASACLRAADLGLIDWSNHYMAGLCLVQLGRDAEAKQQFETALTLSPSRIDVMKELLGATTRASGFSAAERFYASLPDEARTLEVREIWRDTRVNYHVSQIRSHYEKGRIEEGLALLNAVQPELRSRRLSVLADQAKTFRAWELYSSQVRRKTGGRPKVSVLVITYNHEKYIATALDSIIMQKTSCDVDIVVVEDCSTDNTKQVIEGYVEKYPKLIRAFLNPTNIGTLNPPQQKVTHSGFKFLDGDYFCILEGDDYWSSPDKLQKQIEVLEAYPYAAACAHNTIKVYEDGKTPSHRFLFWKNLKKIHDIDDIIPHSFFHASSVLYRNFFQGSPPEHFKSKWSCDIFMNIFHAHRGSFVYLNEDMSVYRAHSGGTYSTMTLAKGRMFNIDGYRRYNRWMGYRYTTAMSYQIHRLCGLLLMEEATGQIPPIPKMKWLKYRAIAAVYGVIFRTLSRYPQLDPAVFWYREPVLDRPKFG